jgi:hypothetical protein
MILALCIAILVAALEFIYIAAHDCKKSHEHAWEITSAKPMELQDTKFGVPIGDPEPVTQVLYRCGGCKEVVTKTLYGRFTLAELRGQVNNG